MSVELMGAVWKADLSRNQKNVLLAYADFADHEGGSVRPSVGYMAWKTGYSERAIQTITRELEEAGIMVLEAGGGGRDRTNRYRIDAEALPQRPSWQETRASRKGAEIAPFSENGAEIAGLEDEKGADFSEKGAEIAPDPSVIQEDLSPRARDPQTIPTLPGSPMDDFDEELVEMETALGQVVRETITFGPDRDKIREVAKALLAQGFAPAEVKLHFGRDGWWYEHNPFGKKEKPWVKNVLHFMAQAVDWRPPEPGSNGQDELRALWNMVKLWRSGRGDLRQAPAQVKRAVNRMGERTLKEANDWQMDHTYWPQFQAMLQERAS